MLVLLSGVIDFLSESSGASVEFADASVRFWWCFSQNLVVIQSEICRYVRICWLVCQNMVVLLSESGCASVKNTWREAVIWEVVWPQMSLTGEQKYETWSAGHMWAGSQAYSLLLCAPTCLPVQCKHCSIFTSLYSQILSLPVYKFHSCAASAEAQLWYSLYLPVDRRRFTAAIQ